MPLQLAAALVNGGSASGVSAGAAEPLAGASVALPPEPALATMTKCFH
jgi:hypothetical protein